MFRASKTRLLAAVLAGVLLGASPAKPQSDDDAKKARKTYAEAQEAEKAQDWPRAFALYSEACAQAPGNGQYLMRRESARFQVVQQHMDRAERAAVADQLTLARAELEAALKLDPGYSVARERLAQLRRPAAQPVQNPEYEDSLPKIRPRPGTHSFNYQGDTRGAYEEIAKQFGVTPSFDPDLRAVQLRFRVDDVDFETAMFVLARQTNTFWWALDARTFFVAENTPQKRRELAPTVVRTVPLSQLATPEQMTEMVRLIREIAGINRTQLDTRTRTLTLRDTPEAVALAAKLVEELEQAAGELMLEVEILEIDRDAALRLGITPPSSAQIFTVSPSDIREAQQSPEALLRVLQRIFGSTTPLGGLTGVGQSGLGALIPPLVAFGGGRSTLLATLPGAVADFSQALSVLRRGRRMLLRAQDGQPATFFIGERFPIALAVLQPNLAGLPLGNIGEGTLFRRELDAAVEPAGVAIGDFNEDGAFDLAVANAGDDSISIFSGTGDGNFSTRTDFPAGASPTSIVTGDFNGDTRLDLAVTNETADTVSILIGAGDGTFTAPSSFATGTTPRAIAVGDFNGDGDLDLAVANAGSDTVSILPGNGTGAFPTQTEFPVEAAPSALVAGNFNGDASVDLAVANQDSDSVSILLGDGAGGFSAPANFDAGDGPTAILAADFNGDGLPDLAVANGLGDTVSVLLGVGDGTFGAGTEFTVGAGPAALVEGDFTADGRTDLVVANRDDDSITILLGTGDGGFGARADFNVGNGPAALAAADLNGDGRRDAAVANRDGNTITVILNQVSVTRPTSPFTSQTVQPYPGFQYEDLGLKVRATPRLHPNNEVTLQLEFEIRSRSGQTINTIPVITNRTLEQTVRLRENETTLLTGVIQRDERFGITGWPGLARTPGIGTATSRRDRDRQETELLISITPRRLRLAQRVDRLFYAGREASRSAGGGQPQRPQP